VTDERPGEEQLQAIGEAAEALWDAARRSQDLLDELEGERLGRWAAYIAFREVGAVFRFALERLRMEDPIAGLADALASYRAGAHAGLEASADLADAVREGGDDSVEMGIQRLTLASQQFVRGRFLLQRYLDETQPDSAEAADGAP
jgi:hypothetical protein